MAIEAHSVRHDAPVTIAPASGVRLADACADLVRKRHLADPAALGRPPTRDEAEIYAAAVEAVAAAYHRGLETLAVSPLQASHAEALRMADDAEALGFAEDGDGDWLGEPLSEQSGEILDGLHLAACTNRADALAKLDAILTDMDQTEDLPAVRGTLTASLHAIHGWLAGTPSIVDRDVVITRREYRQACAAGVYQAPEHQSAA